MAKDLYPTQEEASIGARELEELIASVEFDALIADKAFDIDWIHADLNDRGATAVIPPKADRVRPIACD